MDPALTVSVLDYGYSCYIAFGASEFSCILQCDAAPLVHTAVVHGLKFVGRDTISSPEFLQLFVSSSGRQPLTKSRRNSRLEIGRDKKVVLNKGHFGPYRDPDRSNPPLKVYETSFRRMGFAANLKHSFPKCRCSMTANIKTFKSMSFVSNIAINFDFDRRFATSYLM